MNMKAILVAVVASLELCACAKQPNAVKNDIQEQMAKSAPRDVKILIAGFGTIESVSQVDKWLAEQVAQNKCTDAVQTLATAGTITDSNFVRGGVRVNWVTRRIEYACAGNAFALENARRAAMLTSLHTKVLTDDSQRYVPLAKDYLQSFVSRKARNMIKIVDRNVIDTDKAEKAISDNDSGLVSGASCILTATYGDRECDVKAVPIDGKGTVVKTTVYTQPYTFKVRDLAGNVLMADHGTVSCTMTQNNVARTDLADPARKLTEKMCEQIADSLTSYFTAELQIKVKVPNGMDEDDVEVAVDGHTLSDNEIRVLAIEHLVKASLDGCNTVRKVVEIESGESTKSVKISLKKPTIATFNEEE